VEVVVEGEAAPSLILMLILLPLQQRQPWDHHQRQDQRTLMPPKLMSPMPPPLLCLGHLNQTAQQEAAQEGMQ
jgi:hypothetical protein